MLNVHTADESIYTEMQHRYPVCHTMTGESHRALVQDIPTFGGWDNTKLEDWLGDIETTVDILEESHAHLAKAKSHGLTHTTLFVKHLKLGRAGMTSQLNCV